MGIQKCTWATAGQPEADVTLSVFIDTGIKHKVHHGSCAFGAALLYVQSGVVQNISTLLLTQPWSSAFQKAHAWERCA